MSELRALLDMLIGSEDSITLAQMLVRASLVFILGLALVRLGAPRIFSRATPIDIVLAVIIGSNLSRTLTGNAPFLETVASTVFLVALHAVITRLAARWRPLATIVKGTSHVLAQDGVVDWKAMHAGAIGERDLDAAIRAAGGLGVADVRIATLERNGEINVVLNRPPEGTKTAGAS